MKTWKFSWRLLVFTILMPIILSACTANPVDLSTAFTEIGLDEALIKIPNLKVEVYPYDASKPHEGRNFTPIGMSLEDVMAKRATERENPIARKDYALEGKALSYSYGGLPGSGKVNVQLDGKTIFKAPFGDDSPVDPVGGLWVLDGKWILELIHIKTRNENNTIFTETRGDITVDGKSTNNDFSFDESFDFQLLAEKAFYFYKKDGQIGFYYDGQHVQTGFSEIPHYACCDGAAQNPFHFQNMVSFFASGNEGNYYVEIGVYR